MSGKLSPADAKWVAKAREDFIERVDGKEITALRARVAKLEMALKGVEPYLDAIVCYASTMDEHEPNRLAHNVRAALLETV